MRAHEVEPPSKIKLANGNEQDVFTGWRKMYCYTHRPGVCQSIKRGYNRRLRHKANLAIKQMDSGA
jgi:hypothetical protein